MIYLIFTAIGLLFHFAFKFAYKNSLIVAPWVVVFTCFWTLPVAAFWYWDDINNFTYALKNFNNVALPRVGEERVINAFICIFLSSCSLLAGAYISNLIAFPKFCGVKLKSERVSLSGAVISLFGLWCVVCVFIISSNGLPWFHIFLPAYAEGPKYINYIYRTFYLYLPFIAVALAITLKCKKTNILPILLWGMLVAFSTGQRRDMLCFLFFSFYVYSMSRSKSISNLISYPKFLILFFASMSGVVILWVSRVFFTNYVRDGSIVNPFEMRGFFEIIFGSGATGMPTLFLVSDWVSLHGVQISYNIIYGLSQIIPRSLWYSKPVDIDSIIQDEFGLVDNPSVFWYGDMYFSVGFIFLPIASLFLGLILTAAASNI